MTLAAKVAKNTLIQISGKMISTFLGLFSLALMTRYLGQDGFGEYTTVITFLTFFAVIADLGITLITAQMIGREKDKAKENKILNNLFSLRLVSAILFLALAPITVVFFPYSATVKLGVVIAAISFIFPAMSQVLVGLFQKRLSMDRVSMAEIASRVILIISVMTAIEMNSGLNGILVATIISAASSFIFHYFFSLKFTTIKFAFDLSLWKSILTKSWPLMITIVLNLIYLRADTLILSVFRSSGEVGLYGAAYKIIDVLTTLPFMFAGITLPILTAYWLEKNHKGFKNMLQKSFDFMAIIAIPLVIGAQFLSDPIMTVVAGEDFAGSGIILRVLIFSVAAIFLGTIFSHAVVAIEKQREVIGFYLFTAITSLVAYLYLVPKYSYFGAAGVTIYSEILIACFSLYFVFKHTKFLPDLTVALKSLLATAIMAIVIYSLPIQYQSTLGGLIIVLILAVLIYGISLYYLGGIKPEELELLIKRKGKGGGQTYEPGTNF